MAETTELHDRLMAHARSYDASAHTRGLLAPYRDVLLLWRAKYMSYEQIAAALNQHGIRVSPAGVGVFCRRNYTRAELERARREEYEAGAKSTKVATPASSSRPAPNPPRRGPKIARDNY